MRADTPGVTPNHVVPILHKGVFSFKWSAKDLVGKSKMEVARVLKAIPDIDLTELRIHKRLKRCFTIEQLRQHGSEPLNSVNVFDWAAALLKCMKVYQTHPLCLAERLFEGEFMSERMALAFNNAAQFAQLQPTRSKAFEKVVDRYDLEGAVLWLEAIILWLIQKHGSSIETSTPENDIDRIRMGTKSLHDVTNVFYNIRRLQPALHEDRRTFKAFMKYFEAA